LKTFLMSMLLALCALGAATPAEAQISYTTLDISQGYSQTNAGLSYEGSFVALGLATTTANSFTGASVLTPGASSATALNWNSRLLSNGAYGGNYTYASFPSLDGVVSTNLAELSTAFPFGTYLFVARNSVTGAQQSASLNYNANYWPTTLAGGQAAVPALSSASFAALQGLNATSPVTLKFNAFTGNAVLCCNETPQSNPSVSLLVFNSSTGAIAYNSGALAATAGSLVLPANTLAVNTSYSYSLVFDVMRHCGLGQSCDNTNPIGSALIWETGTDGEFTTLMAPPPNTTTVNLQGGTLAHPVPLQSEGRIGQVNGAIGGAGAEDFYVFYWAGGLFQANAQLYGADPHDSYQFELMDQHGTVLATYVLDQSNNFTASLSRSLAKGPNYEIGLLASSSNIDPNYSITLTTPIVAVPEPSMAALAGLGLAVIGLAQRRRKSRT